MPDPRDSFYDGSDTPFRIDPNSATSAEILPHRAPDPRPDDMRCRECGDTRPQNVIDCPRCDLPRGHVHGGRGGLPDTTEANGGTP